MSHDKKLSKIYNPAEENPDDLINNFVVRTDVFNTIFDDIKSSTMEKPEQDYLLIGHRGMGKTTLLYRLKYAIQRDEKLSEWLIPVTFPEEHYGITELADFWERTAEYLEKEFPEFAGLVKQIQNLLSTSSPEKKIFDTLIRAIKEKNKKVVLFIDNFGDLLDKFEEIEVKKLREELMTCKYIRIVAASPIVLEETHHYDHPLYEFFNEIKLKGLNKEETFSLLRMLAETSNESEKIEKIISNHPGRVETLRQLTGGVVRTIVLLFEIMTDLENGSAFGDLESMLDRVTPLYKARMDELKPQQQKIVDAIAKAWDPVSTGEIADKVRIESKQVSAQIKQLMDNQVIQKIETDTKNNLYFIGERFFNIWYLMRHSGSSGKEKVKWLTRFIEGWYNPFEIKEIVQNFITALSNQDHSKNSLFLTAIAISETDSIDIETRDELIEKSKEMMVNEGQIDYSDYSFMTEIEMVDKVIESLHHKDIPLAVSLVTNIQDDRIKKSINYLIKYLIPANLLKFNEMIQQVGMELRIKEFSSFLFYLNAGIIFRTAVFKFEKANHRSMSKLIYCYILLANKVRKEYAFKLALELSKSFEDKAFFPPVIICSLWNNIFEIEKYFSVYGSTRNDIVEELDINFILNLLISKKQYHTAYNLFQQHNLKDKFKPIYYALMYFMQDEYPNEYLKVTPEIKEIVESVFARIKQMETDYA